MGVDLEPKMAVDDLDSWTRIVFICTRVSDGVRSSHRS